MRRVTAPPALAVLAVSLVACGTNTSTDYHPLAAFSQSGNSVISQPAPAGLNTQTASARPKTAALSSPNKFATSLVLVEPTNGATIKGGTVVVKVSLNGKLVSAGLLRRPQAPPDAVHLHFIFDGGGRFDDPQHTGVGAALRALDNSGNQHTPSVTPQVTYRGIPLGKHTIWIELVHNSHNPGSALSSARAVFTVLG
jgi:hypothetical protein